MTYGIIGNLQFVRLLIQLFLDNLEYFLLYSYRLVKILTTATRRSGRALQQISSGRLYS